MSTSAISSVVHENRADGWFGNPTPIAEVNRQVDVIKYLLYHCPTSAAVELSSAGYEIRSSATEKSCRSEETQIRGPLNLIFFYLTGESKAGKILIHVGRTTHPPRSTRTSVLLGFTMLRIADDLEQL